MKKSGQAGRGRGKDEEKKKEERQEEKREKGKERKSCVTQQIHVFGNYYSTLEDNGLNSNFNSRINVNSTYRRKVVCGRTVLQMPSSESHQEKQCHTCQQKETKKKKQKKTVNSAKSIPIALFTVHAVKRCFVAYQFSSTTIFTPPSLSRRCICV